MRTLRLLAVVIATILLNGCASVAPQMYVAETPKLDLYEYFDGRVDAWGYFADRSGKVVRRFTVTIEGTISDGALTLNEQFKYSDGTNSQRVWTIRRSGENGYTGTAGDVIGIAQGSAYGNALQWAYVLSLEVDGQIGRAHV